MVFLADISGMEDARSPFVIYVEAIDGIGQTFNKILDDKDVVYTITVGCYHRGEFQHIVDDDDKQSRSLVPSPLGEKALGIKTFGRPQMTSVQWMGISPYHEQPKLSTTVTP